MQKLIFLFLLVTSLHVVAFADGPAPPLAAGMRSADVVSLWGEPSNRQIFETRREELWSYPERTVRFREGRVAQWEDLARSRAEEMPIALIGNEAVVASEEKQVAVADILSEIMKEGAEEGDSKKKR